VTYVQPDEIDQLTAHHPPRDQRVIEAHETVRREVNRVMHVFNRLLAESPQKTHLLRQMLPQVMMAANQVIAVHGVYEQPVNQVVAVQGLAENSGGSD
jgi:ABC-type transporter Mla maintaining outer membrane lipid asymmetry permease subunit MlaE